MKNEPRTFFNDGHFAAETAKHLGEFQTDIAAPDDHEMRRRFFELKNGGIGEVGNLMNAGQIWHGGAASHVDEEPIGADCLRANLDLMAGNEASRLWEDCAGGA